jgi:hypothetical protein
MGQDARTLDGPTDRGRPGWWPYLVRSVPLVYGTGDASRREHFMYTVLAYGFVAFTTLLVVLLLVFWWQESRAAARRRKLGRTKI